MPKKSKPRPAYQWGDESYASRRAVEQAIAAACCSYLVDGDCGSVTHGRRTFCLHVRVRLIR